MIFPSLAHPATQDPARFGGKSAHLAGLAAQGFPIPPGFAIPAEVVVTWQAPLIPRIEAEIARLDRMDAQQVASQIADIFLSQPLGKPLCDALAQSCMAHLPAGLSSIVAVRSSAVGEDAAEASFAGQFESLLGVSGPEQMGHALRAVWASLYSARAIQYRHKAGLPAAASPMGVVVLDMVDAVASGVAFSVDVVTGKRDRIVIEATHGLAEPLVQGQITPDHLVIDKAELRLMSLREGRKDLICTMTPSGGTVTRTATVSEQCDISLSPLLAEQLAATVARLETVMGHPVDIEWAIGREDEIRLLQVRPISSALPSPPDVRWDRAGCLAG